MINRFSPLTTKIYLVFLAVFVALSCDIAQDRDMEIDTGGVAGDRAVLGMLYSMTGGSKWAENEYWNTDMPLDQWHGVTTDSDSRRVTDLNLNDNGLEGKVPEVLGSLTGLENLDLSGNYGLVGLLPPSLMDLSGLMTLDIRGTGLCAAPVVLQEWLDGGITVFQGETCQEIEKIAISYDESEYEAAEGQAVSLPDVSSALEARSSPSISIELSPGHHVPVGTGITGIVTLNNLDINSYSSVIFRADLEVFGHGETRCDGDDTGRDIEIEVDEAQETFTVRIYDACPHRTYGNYTLNASISRDNELASTSTRFLMTRFLSPGEAIASPPAPGVQAWMDPDPMTFNFYVGQWYRFRFRSDILLYLDDHLGVNSYGYEEGLFVATNSPSTPGTTVEEACGRLGDFPTHWRRAIHQSLWIAACRSDDAIIDVQHGTDAVPPLYRYEFRTLARGESSNPAPPVPTPDPAPPVSTPDPVPPVSTPDPAPPVSTPDPAPPVSTPDPAPPVFTPDPAPPVSTPDNRVRESESGGCAIVSREVVNYTSESILLNLFLTLSVLFSRVSRKSRPGGG